MIDHNETFEANSANCCVILIDYALTHGNQMKDLKTSKKSVTFRVHKKVKH